MIDIMMNGNVWLNKDQVSTQSLHCYYVMENQYQRMNGFNDVYKNELVTKDAFNEEERMKNIDMNAMDAQHLLVCFIFSVSSVARRIKS